MRNWLEEIPQVEGLAVFQEEGVQEHATKEDWVESKVSLRNAGDQLRTKF